MIEAKTLVGLDVHATKTVAAILDPRTGELRFDRLGGEVAAVADLCRRVPGPVRAVYEAGPTGYRLARTLREAGVDCVVAAPGKIPRAARDKVKTDRRDAEHLVRLLVAGELRAVAVPEAEEEALRDLVRARDDLRRDLMRARHRLSKLLLRRGIRFDGRAWTQRHASWLAQIELEHEPAQVAYNDYLGAVAALEVRRAVLEREIERLARESSWAPTIGRLRCLRGIDTLSAVGLCAEIGDFERFAKAGQLMSFVGLVPSEHSTGSQRRQGAITRTGSDHARRLLVEAAWHYRRRPHVSQQLERRQQGQPPAAVAIAWQAQRRLYRLLQRMERRGKRRNVATVAAARELAGFCWAIARSD